MLNNKNNFTFEAYQTYYLTSLLKILLNLQGDIG